MDYRDHYYHYPADEYGSVDPRGYFNEETRYLLTSHRFPEGIQVTRLYSLPDTTVVACEPVGMAGIVTYATPSELLKLPA